MVLGFNIWSRRILLNLEYAGLYRWKSEWVVEGTNSVLIEVLKSSEAYSPTHLFQAKVEARAVSILFQKWLSWSRPSSWSLDSFKLSWSLLQWKNSLKSWQEAKNLHHVRPKIIWCKKQKCGVHLKIMCRNNLAKIWYVLLYLTWLFLMVFIVFEWKLARSVVFSILSFQVAAFILREKISLSSLIMSVLIKRTSFLLLFISLLRLVSSFVLVTQGHLYASHIRLERLYHGGDLS